MAENDHLQAFLDGAKVGPEVFKLRPDYRALLMIIDGITPGPSDEISERMLKEAETSARAELATTSIPHVAAWREAFKSFGAKPNKTRNSLEALTRRLEKPDGALPRINRLTDVYNAISIKHQIPLGGEDVEKYSGPPHLMRATGKENFELISSGEAVVEHPDAGEVVWCDGEGVTCRRWNWRQSRRTALTDETTTAVFFFDALEPCSDEALTGAGEELAAAVKQFSPEVRVLQRVIGASDSKRG